MASLRLDRDDMANSFLSGQQLAVALSASLEGLGLMHLASPNISELDSKCGTLAEVFFCKPYGEN
jgi:hypothetical protein